MDYQVYAALFSVWGLPHPLFGAKVGHSKCSIQRANNLLLPYNLQDLFVLRFLSRNEAIKTEDYINYKLNKLFASGGSSEAHLMPMKKLQQGLQNPTESVGRKGKLPTECVRSFQRGLVSRWLASDARTQKELCCLISQTAS